MKEMIETMNILKQALVQSSVGSEQEKTKAKEFLNEISDDLHKGCLENQKEYEKLLNLLNNERGYNN